MNKMHVSQLCRAGKRHRAGYANVLHVSGVAGKISKCSISVYEDTAFVCISRDIRWNPAWKGVPCETYKRNFPDTMEPGMEGCTCYLSYMKEIRCLSAVGREKDCDGCCHWKKRSIFV